VDGLTDWLGAVVANYPTGSYVVLFACAVAENLFPPFPGDTVMIFGGYLVGLGALGFWSTVGVMFAGHICAFVGLVLVGRTLGRAALMRIKWIKASEPYIDRAEVYAKSYGVFFILANRFIPGLRAVVSIVAGLLQMPLWRVIPAAAISIAAWNYMLIRAGSELGENWEQVIELINRYNMIAGAILAVVAVVVGIQYYRNRKRNNEG
jgi:membrane protein DedA with SNARE-associated domain